MTVSLPRMVVLVACSVAVVLLVGAASASAVKLTKAEMESLAAKNLEVHTYTEPYKERDLVCPYGGECSESEFSLPAGMYLQKIVPAGEDIWTGYGAIHAGIHCENAYKLEGCSSYEYYTGAALSIVGEVPGRWEPIEHQVWEYTNYAGGYFISTDTALYFRAESAEKEAEETETELLGSENGAEPDLKGCHIGHPVNCATGNQTVTQADLAVGGRGPALDLTRTYNSRLAAKQTEHGPFGFGWTGSYSARLELKEEGKTAVVHQDNASTVTFARMGEVWVATSHLVEATLAAEGTGYVYKLPNQTALHFNSSGQLTSEVDRDGNALTMSYKSGRLASITDTAGRKITLAYNVEGEVESAKDPMGHTVKYAYEGGTLKSVTQPGEAALRWQFKYNAGHELTSETDGRGNIVKTEYNGSHQVSSQTDPLSRKREWKYTATEAGTETKITEPNGGITIEQFNEAGSPTSVTHAAETGIATTATYAYNVSGELITATDPNKDVTKFGYDSTGDRTSQASPLGRKTEWEFDSTHDVIGVTLPDGEKTAIKRDTRGNPEAISRPAPSSTTQTRNYKFKTNGDLESVEDPLKHVTKYEYDSYGDRSAETDPEGNKQTWSYNEDSQLVSSVSPRGNVTGGEPAKFTTSIERDALGRPTAVTEPEARGAMKPVSRTGASISGVARENQTLSAAPGVWEGTAPLTYSYQWEHCNAAGAGCSALSGETAATYPLYSGDLGYTIRVVVTASNSLGSASSTSEATAVVSVTQVFASAIGVGMLSHPAGDAVDGHGDLWVASSKASPWVQEFSTAGVRLGTFGETGTGEKQFENPTGIAVNKSTGAVYVADSSNDRVVELNEKGVAQKGIGSKGAGAGQFEKPVAVAVDGSGNVWVADYTGQRVDEFNKEGTFVKAFGYGVKEAGAKLEVCTTESKCKIGKSGSAAGQFNDPSGVALANGDLYVSDGGNNRVELFTTAGGYLGEEGSSGSGNGQYSHPQGIGVDAAGNLYVADAGNSRVQEVGAYAEYVAVFGSAGTGNGQFKEPYDVALDSFGELFVADTENSRVQRWDKTTMPVFSSIIGTGDFAHAGFDAIDSHGNVWATDSWGSKVEELSASGTLLGTHGEWGSALGDFEEPVGIAINQSTGNMYVADGDLGHVTALNEKGEATKDIGSKGTGVGQLLEPVGVAVDSSGNIWVADVAAERVAEFNKEGTFVKAFGWGVNKNEGKLEVCTTSCREGEGGSGAGEFSGPVGVAISGGNLYVSDLNNARIEEFSTAGAYVAQFGTAGSAPGQLSYPHGVGVGPSGDLFVADSENNRVTEFTPTGNVVGTFGSVGTGNGQFEQSNDIAVNSAGELYVTDANNQRIQKWVPASTPYNTALPAISGELQQSQVLAASTGDWTGATASSYSYQWQRCNRAGGECANITGATASTHTLVSADIATTLRVVATATNSAGSTTAASSPTEYVTGARITSYIYDGDGNLETVLGPTASKTKYTYDADNEPTKVEEPNGTITETGYDSEGQVTSQTDGNKHVTEYVRSLLEEVIEVIDPLKRKTVKEYDKAGNLLKTTDALKRTTTNTYNEDDQLTATSYSEGKPEPLEYEYNGDGYVTKIKEGTGEALKETTYTYDQLDRITETKNRNKEKDSYEYNLANQQTKITYPNTNR